MTLRRRKSRALTVDGVRYRWLVTSVSEFNLQLIVEHDRGQGQRLVLTRGEVFGASRVPPITPRYVAASIRHALRTGWTPLAPGTDLCVDSSLLGAPSATVSTERYGPMVEQLERDLRGFLERAERWLAARATAQTTEQLAQQLRAATGLGERALRP